MTLALTARWFPHELSESCFVANRRKPTKDRSKVFRNLTGMVAVLMQAAGYNIVQMKARVYVTMKPSVLDAQGQAVRTALRSMGHDMVRDVRQGKYFELDLSATDRAAASAELEKISHEILSNPVIEQYRVEIVE